MPYINFSDDDLYRANTADLVSFLQSHGEQVKKVVSTYKYIYTDGSGTHDSVTIHGGKRSYKLSILIASVLSLIGLILYTLEFSIGAMIIITVTMVSVLIIIEIFMRRRGYHES